MAQNTIIGEENEITPVQFQASEIATKENLDPAQTSLFSRVSDMVSNDMLSLSNMFNNNNNNDYETTESIQQDYNQFLELQKLGKEAKNIKIPQQGIDAVAEKIKRNIYTLNPAVVNQQATELTGYSTEQIKSLQIQLNLPTTGKADKDTVSNLLTVKGFLGIEKTSKFLDSILDGTLEGTRTNPIKNNKVLKHPLMKYGQAAVEAIEQREGTLSYIEKRIAEEEGFFNGFYYDSKGVVTFGVGQTKKYIDKSFKETVKAHTNIISNLLVDYKSMPEKIQAELVQSAYRGGITGSDKTIKLINKKYYQQAEREFLNHDEYRKAKREGSGIAKRMEKTAMAIRRLSSVMVAQN